MITDPAQQARNVLSRVLVASGFGFVAIGIFLGLWLGEIYFLIALVGLIDFALAWA